MTNTFMNWFNGNNQAVDQLSEESKQKVMLITDINKAQKLINGKDINHREFDYLYDMPLAKLQEHDNQIKLRVEGGLRFNEYMKRANPETDVD